MASEQHQLYVPLIRSLSSSSGARDVCSGLHVPLWLGPAHKLHGGRAGSQGDRNTGGTAPGEEEAQCTGLDVVSIEQYI